MRQFFRGFMFNFGAGFAIRFPDKLRLIEQQSSGRVTARFPCKLGDDWYDSHGTRHPAPVPPANLQNTRLPFEVQLNSGRIYCTAHRGVIERSFGKDDWSKKLLGGREQIPHQYLERWGRPPTPEVPVIHVLLMVDMAIEVMSALAFALLYCKYSLYVALSRQ